MAYATVQDMIDRFSAQEMVRLTTPDGMEMDGVHANVAEAALSDASALIDSYVGRRYRVPMDVPLPAIIRACCALARYDLACGEQKSPTEQMATARKETVAWLVDISMGRAVLELDEVATGDESYAQATERRAVYGNSPWT